MMFWFVCMYGSALRASGELMPFKRGCESPSRKPKLNRTISVLQVADGRSADLLLVAMLFSRSGIAFKR